LTFSGRLDPERLMVSVVLMRVLVFWGLCPLWGCVAGQKGQPLAQLPPVTVQVLINVSPSGGASAGVNLLPVDTTQCPKIGDDVKATIDGRALGLSETGGFRRRKGGDMYCEPPRFDGPGIPLSGDLTLELHDTSATWTVAAQGALRTAGVVWDQPADGAMVAGQRAAIRLQPTFGTITYARVGFVPTGASTSSFFVEYPGADALLSAGALSFSVPATAAAASGALHVSASIDVPASRCEGPSACKVQTGVDGTVAASVGAP
jgi:hypothetical protein